MGEPRRGGDAEQLARPARVVQAPEQGVENALTRVAVVELLDLVDENAAEGEVHQLGDVRLLKRPEQELGAGLQLDDLVRGAVHVDELAGDQRRHVAVTEQHRLLCGVLQLAVGRAADEVRARLRDGALDDQPARRLRLAAADRAADRDEADARVAPEPRGGCLFRGSDERRGDARLSRHRCPASGTPTRG